MTVDTSFTVTRTTPYNELPQWLSPREASAVLGLSTWAIYQYVHQGEIPHRRIGRKTILIPKEYFHSDHSTRHVEPPVGVGGPR